MTTLRFRSSESELPAGLIAQLRRITNLSLAEIRNRTSTQQPLLEITPFQNDWQDARRLLMRIAHEMRAGTLPLTVTEVHDTDESHVSLEKLQNLIQHFREIELQTQRDTMLELGEIHDLSEFAPYDDDWTQ